MIEMTTRNDYDYIWIKKTTKEELRKYKYNTWDELIKKAIPMLAKEKLEFEVLRDYVLEKVPEIQKVLREHERKFIEIEKY